MPRTIFNDGTTEGGSNLPVGGFIKPGTYAMIELADGTTRLLIDVTVSEDHSFESEVTDFPVESGGTISDNIRKRPIVVTMDGLVSNTPLDPMRGLRGDEADVAAQSAYFFLVTVWDRGEPVTVRTSLGTFKNMALSSLNLPRTKDDGDALKFTARFQQIVTVKHARVGSQRKNGDGGRGGQPGLDKSSKGVLWRKGISRVFGGNPKLAGGVAYIYSGGSRYIGDIERVYWKKHADVTSRDAAGFPTVGTAASAGGQPRGDGAWYHYGSTAVVVVGSSSTMVPLNAEEHARFKLDMARDARGTEVDFNALQNRDRWRRNYDLEQDKATRPIDLNATNRRTIPLDNAVSRGSKQ